MERALFKAYPELKGAIPYCELATLPTPVQSLDNIGTENAWIKRDDLSHNEYGGNKVRKLEFILPEINRGNKNHVFTFGAIGSNAGVATSMMCQQNDLRCTIFLFDQPITDTVKRNLAQMQAYGAKLIYVGSLLQTALRFYLSPHRLDPKAYFLFAGCSNPIATFAYVSAAFELKEQIEKGLCPEPEIIHVPVGSCATLAGLTLGIKLAGLNTQVKGTRVAPSHVGPIESCTPKVINKMIERTTQTLQAFVPSLEKLEAPTCILLEDQYGAGYGHSTKKANKAITLMNEKEHIPLEGTYSGKAFASFQDDLKQKKGPILFWNTFNSKTLKREPIASQLSNRLTKQLTQSR